MEKTILDACCGGGSEKYKKFGGGARLVSFLDQNSLIPLFDGDFGAVLSNPVVFEVNKTVLCDVADFQQKAQYEAPKFELVQMFNRSTSAAILYSTC